MWRKLAYLDRPSSDAKKPHGRLAVVFLIKHRGKDCPAYVDLSVTPRT